MEYIHKDMDDETDFPVDDGKLVDVVAKYPALYNIKLPEYHNTAIKGRCWEIISKELGHPVGKCMERWTRLKDNYRREKNKRESESRSGQGLSHRKGFALYGSMDFMRPHTTKRKSFTNVKSTKPKAATQETVSSYLASQISESATWGTQYQHQYVRPLNPSVSCMITSECQDQLFTKPQAIPNIPSLMSWPHVPPTTTLNSPDILSTLHRSTYETSTPVWMPSSTVSTPSPTVSHSLATNGTTSIKISPSANPTQPAVTFIIPTTTTESNIESRPAAESIATSISTTATELNTIYYTPTVTPNPSVRTPTPNLRVPQSSSPAPPSYADSVYSPVDSDLSHDFDLNDADTIPTRNSHDTIQRDNSLIKSASASLSFNPVKITNKNYSPAIPKQCYNKDTARQKKLDPLEACMIPLSNSIKGTLEAEHVPKQTARTSDEVFGNMVVAELSQMDDKDKATTKSLIVDILFARGDVVTSSLSYFQSDQAVINGMDATRAYIPCRCHIFKAPVPSVPSIFV